MNNNSKFAHLHLHTEHSTLDGYGSARQFVDQAIELGFKYLAITDHGSVAGCLNFQKECNKQDIQPILGCEFYIVNSLQNEFKSKSKHIILLAKNHKGWTEICRMLTIANLKGFYHKPRIDFEILLSADLSGIIILTGCVSSFIHLKEGIITLNKLADKTEVYLEIMPHNIPAQDKHNKTIKKLHEELGLPLVATNDAHYVKRSDWKAQEVLLAIQRRAKWNDKNRWSFGFRGLHLRTENEMIKMFERQGIFNENQITQAMKNTITIAKKCSNFRIPKLEISLPTPPIFRGKDENECLRDLCLKGYKRIFHTDDWNPIYQERFDEEFSLIKSKHFSRYFLVVYDLIQYAKRDNIGYGPGRGSVSGSLIAYLIGITQRVDPIEFNLSFSRFISEDRIDFPDIDIDFADDKRHFIREYLYKTYGQDKVCGISTDMRMKSRAVLWDIARVFELPSDAIKRVIKEIGYEDNALQTCIEETKSGMAFAKQYPEETGLVLRLENQIRGNGQHPAAIVISDDDLTTGKRGNLRIQRDASGKKTVVSCWNMKDSEYFGLMKLDILGLSTISVLSEISILIKENYNKSFSFDKMTVDDPKIFKMLSDGNTTGVFQISTPLCTRLCKDVAIDCFDDIAAIVALARPGPLGSGMADKYIDRKHGQLWKKMHPIYEEITKNTYGILVYQEQIMQVISKVAGLTETIADKIRKIVGKKRDPKEFEQYKIQFLDGCIKMKTLTKKQANNFWNELQSWSSYGFNKAHAVGYAIISYSTAWAKLYYPAEFIAASLTCSKKDEKQDLINDALDLGLKVITPKMSISDINRWLIKNDKLYIPFTEINSIGESQAKKHCLKNNKAQTGFFNINPVPNTSTQIGLTLKEVGIYEDKNFIPSTKAIEKHFSFHICLQEEKADKYPNLVKTIGFSIPKKDLDDFLTLKINPGEVQDGLITRKRYRLEQPILQCEKCDLRKQTKQGPVLSSVGLHNVIILLEAPGEQEDKEGKGAVGPAGNVLWEELAKYKYYRRFFHTTNCNRCWPSQSNTPSHAEVTACNKWLRHEISKLDCKLILAAGNVPLYALTGRKGGIQALSGETKWIEELNLWVCFCVHPSAVLRNSNNRVYFEKGIKNFIKCIELLK